MFCKNKVTLGISKYKAKLPQLLLRPLPCSDNLCRRLLKICPVPNGSRSQSNGDPVHRIGIEGILDIVQIADQLWIADGIADAGSRQRTGLREGLHNDQIIILIYERQGALPSKINIGFIHHHNDIPVRLNDCLNFRKRQQFSCRRIGIWKDYAAILSLVILRMNAECLIQRNLLVRDAKHLRPHIIEGIGNIRK